MPEEVRWAVEKDRVTMNEEYRGRGENYYHIAHASLLVFFILIIYFGGN